VLTRKLVETASKGSKSKKKYEYLLKEIDRIEEVMSTMDDEADDELQKKTTTTRTVVNMEKASNEDNTSSAIQLLDPDIANIKGRPRHLTIREAIKANKFYSTYQKLRNLEDQRRLSQVRMYNTKNS
jgi:phosphoenolpyruvate carboxylase